MKSIRNILVALSVVLLLSLATGALSRSRIVRYDSKYRVFCSNGKIEVEQRTLEQQKNARGSNVCQLAEFDYLSDAEKDAEKRGGKGAECKCS
jgi:hypothetical protein